MHRIMLKFDGSIHRFDSQWWKDLMCIGDSLEVGGLMMQYSCKLGEGTLVLFWFSRCLEMLSLYRRFPQLFEVSESKYMAAWELGNWGYDSWQ